MAQNVKMAGLVRCAGRRLVLALVMALPGCVAAGRMASLAAPAPVYDPLQWFTGASTGTARLSVMMRKAVPVAVQSRGRIEPDGSLLLEQAVRDNGGPPRQREWRLRRAGEGRLTGTLSDAEGPVTGEYAGNRLHLAFRLKGGLSAQQWLYLQPDGKTVQNRMVVRKWGMPVASLTETITREVAVP